MPGAPDPLYVRARRALLDALEALAEHRQAVVLVGAQAIYLHTGEADLAVAAYTTDADLALDPASLADEPALEALMRRAGFSPAPEPGRVGTWLDPSGIPIDLLVPDAVGGGGRRGARLGPHGDRVARKGRGLEAALVDRVEMTVGALDEADPRRMAVAVAGPAALLVAKLHKIAERQGRPDRLDDKDALDVYRLLVAISTENLERALSALRAHPLSHDVTEEAIPHLSALFGGTQALGVAMALRAAAPLADPETLAASLAALVGDLLLALRERGP